MALSWRSGEQGESLARSRKNLMTSATSLLLPTFTTLWKLLKSLLCPGPRQAFCTPPCVQGPMRSRLPPTAAAWQNALIEALADPSSQPATRKRGTPLSRISRALVYGEQSSIFRPLSVGGVSSLWPISLRHAARSTVSWVATAFFTRPLLTPLTPLNPATKEAPRGCGASISRPESKA